MKRLRSIGKEMWRDARQMIAGAILLAFVLYYLNHRFGTVCWLRIIFGIPCPTCGITRATVLALQGNFSASFYMHPLLVFIPIGVILYLMERYFLKKKVEITKIYGMLIIVLFVVFYLYRMWNYFPNQEPMLYDAKNYVRYWMKLLHEAGK